VIIYLVECIEVVIVWWFLIVWKVLLLWFVLLFVCFFCLVF